MSDLSLAALAALVLVPRLAAQSTYYVDAAAAPPGQGTLAQPWTEIQTALDVPTLGDGDLILVAPGVYEENLHIGASGFTLESTHGALQTELRPQDEAASVVAVGGGVLAGLGTVIEGFTIAGSDHRGISAQIPDLTVRNCILHSNAVGLSNAWTCTLEGCTITGNGKGTIVWAGADTTVRDSIVWGNAVWDLVVSTLYSSHWVTHSLFPWSTSGVPPWNVSSNLHRDPRFWDPAGGDFHLEPRSKAIGAGSTGGDMGALPFDDTYAPATPRTFCRSKPNSQGCEPAIAAAGTPSASGAPFTISCAQVVSHKQGFLYYGHRTGYAPFQGGWQCVNGPTRRTALESSGGAGPGADCSGSFAVDFGALIGAGLDPALVAGAPVFAQFWYRDPTEPTGFGDGRSDGIAFALQP